MTSIGGCLPRAGLPWAGSDATAVAYVEAADEKGSVAWGVGMDANILTASLRAVVSAVTRLGINAETTARR